MDDDLIVFQKDKIDIDSDLLLVPADDGNKGPKRRNGTNYVYLIEIFLAKEFLEDWMQSLDYSPDARETAERLFEYAIYDA